MEYTSSQPEKKRCTKCGRELPLSEFWKSANTRHRYGYYSICKACCARLYRNRGSVQNRKREPRPKKIRLGLSRWGGKMLRTAVCQQCKAYHDNCFFPDNSCFGTDIAQTCRTFVPKNK